MERNLIELKKLIESGNRDYFVLLDYLKSIESIENIEDLYNDITKIYPKDKDLYIELANCFMKNNNIYKSINCLEKYRENEGNNTDALILLSKEYLEVKSYEKAKQLLEEINKGEKINSEQRKEVEILLSDLEKKLIETKTSMFFENTEDIHVITKEIKDMLINLRDNQNYFSYNLFNKIASFIQKLNLEDRFEDVKFFFKEIYNIIPDNNKKFKNILLNEYEIATKQIVLKSYPRKIRVELTHKCNVSCIMCKVRNDGFEVSDKEINDLLEIMPYIQEITLQGGEIFFDSRLNSILDSIIKYQPMKLTVVTNGLLLNNSWLEKLSKTNIELTFSIDSQKKEVYEKIRVGGNFDKLINNLKLAKTILKDKKLVLNMVVMKCNYKEIEDMIRFASNYGFSEIHLNPVDGDVCKEENFFSYKIDENIIDEIKNKSEDYDNLAKECRISLLNRLPTKEKVEVKVEDIKVSPNTDIKDEQIFCYNPFKQMFLTTSSYAPNCECINVIDNVEDLKKDNNLILQKWNGFVMREYRKAMIEHRENMVCKEICRKHIGSRRISIK